MLLGTLFFAAFLAAWIAGNQLISSPSQAAVGEEAALEATVPNQGEVEP